MKKSKPILGLKPPRDFTLEERKLVVEDFLESGLTKADIWEKYTGRRDEHGYITTWMRYLGYYVPTKQSNLALSKEVYMAKKLGKSIDENQLKEKIKQLEQALINSELRATALDTMIEVAEKELNINIRKKSNTKPSSK
jgi:hypothetical protein